MVGHLPTKLDPRVTAAARVTFRDARRGFLGAVRSLCAVTRRSQAL
jgi:hypothetical protein